MFHPFTFGNALPGKAADETPCQVHVLQCLLRHVHSSSWLSYGPLLNLLQPTTFPQLQKSESKSRNACECCIMNTEERWINISLKFLPIPVFIQPKRHFWPSLQPRHTISTSSATWQPQTTGPHQACSPSHSVPSLQLEVSEVLQSFIGLAFLSLLDRK